MLGTHLQESGEIDQGREKGGRERGKGGGWGEKEVVGLIFKIAASIKYETSGRDYP